MANPFSEPREPGDYEWEFDPEKGELIIYSECCADVFSPEQLSKLYDALDGYYFPAERDEF